MAILLPEIARPRPIGDSLKNTLGARALDEPALVQEQHLVGEAPRLTQVVRHHHDLRAGRVHRRDDALDLVGRARIEARGRLVEEQHLGIERPRAREREALLLAAGEHARRPVGEAPSPTRASAARRAVSARRGRHAGEHFSA